MLASGWANTISEGNVRKNHNLRRQCPQASWEFHGGSIKREFHQGFLMRFHRDIEILVNLTTSKYCNPSIDPKIQSKEQKTQAYPPNMLVSLHICIQHIHIYSICTLVYLLVCISISILLHTCVAYAIYPKHMSIHTVCIKYIYIYIYIHIHHIIHIYILVCVCVCISYI